MTEAEYVAGEPGVDGTVELVQFAGKEVIYALNDNQMIFARERGDERFDFFDGAVFVLASVYEQFGLVALPQERKIRAVERNTQADQVRNALVFAPDSQANPRAETESCQQQRHAGKFPSKKIERCADISLFAAPVVVYTGAKPCAAKIESQDRNTEGIQRFRRPVDHFVVHRAAKKRVRMADDRGERRTRGSGRRPENRFEASGRSFQKEIAGVVSDGHQCAMDKFAV